MSYIENSLNRKVMNLLVNNTGNLNTNNPSKNIEEKNPHHKDYILILFLLLLGFFAWSFYLYNFLTIKNKNKPLLKQKDDLIANHIKYENLKYLSIANLIRGLSLIYLIICYNKNSNDLISFGNYFCHIFPTIIFLTVFIFHVRFFIEKYYEITTKKKDIFFTPTIQFFIILIYVILFTFAITCIAYESYKSFFFLGNGLISFLSLILSLLYFYYGINLSNFFSKVLKNGEEIKERKLIHDKLLFVSIFVGISCLERSIFTFLISINFFNDTYPTFLNINIWDFLNFFLNEFLVSIIIGHSKKKTEDPSKKIENFQLKSFNFNENNPNLDYTEENKLNEELNNQLLI